MAIVLELPLCLHELQGSMVCVDGLCVSKNLSEERGKTQWENPPLKLNTESSLITLMNSPPTVNEGK